MSLTEIQAEVLHDDEKPLESAEGGKDLELSWWMTSTMFCSSTNVNVRKRDGD